MLEIICLLLYVALSIVGYRKDNRNLLLSASLLLLIGMGGADFIAGFIDGYHNVN